MDIVKVQTWECLLHNKNSIFHHNHEQELFLQLLHPANLKEFKRNYIGRSGYVKRMFYFSHHEFIDPLHIKYKDFIYSLHPGHTRLLGKTIINENFDPIRCIVYSKLGEKLLPITGLELLNKIEVIDFPAEHWEYTAITDYDIIGRYSKAIDTHFVSAEEYWAQHTQDLYRVFFGDMNFFIFPNQNNYNFNNRIDINIENFTGLIETIRYIFKSVKND